MSGRAYVPAESQKPTFTPEEVRLACIEVLGRAPHRTNGGKKGTSYRWNLLVTREQLRKLNRFTQWCNGNNISYGFTTMEGHKPHFRTTVWKKPIHLDYI